MRSVVSALEPQTLFAGAKKGWADVDRARKRDVVRRLIGKVKETKQKEKHKSLVKLCRWI